MKTESMSIKEFMARKPVPMRDRVVRHIEKYGVVYKVVGMTAIVLITSGGAVFAADPSMLANPVDPSAVAPSTAGLEPEARKLYRQLVMLGKWAIVFRGAFDIIKALGNGDTPAAKKSFLSYLIMYACLLGLPYGMDKVDDVFRSVTTK